MDLYRLENWIKGASWSPTIENEELFLWEGIIRPMYQYELGSEILERSSAEKYLGVLVDNK